MRQARAYNQDHRLTGLLLYAAGPREFVQVLEGPQDEVEDLYQKIAQDPRHKHAFVLHEGLATGRMFPDWRMGFGAYRRPRPAHHYRLLPADIGARLRPPGLAVHAPEQLRRFLADFATPGHGRVVEVLMRCSGWRRQRTAGQKPAARPTSA
ncbi:MAG: BLUF domain-containing protein [Hymenobacter sp.]